MNFKLIEDFVSLAETGNFSKSAKSRNVTQPAFSRRIQQLENWVGIPLVDRTSCPTKLTSAGKIFHDVAVTSLKSIYETKAILKDQTSNDLNILRFSAPYTISSYFLPKWLTKIKKKCGELSTKLNTNFSYDHFENLIEKKCDFLICHYHPTSPLMLEANQYEYKILGYDKLLPVSALDTDGRPLHSLPGLENAKTSFLSYHKDSYLGKITNHKIASSNKRLFLNQVYESATTDSLKRMAIEGHGLAWLPYSCIRDAISENFLIIADEEYWASKIEIRIYRSKTNFTETTANLWSTIPKTTLKAI